MADEAIYRCINAACGRPTPRRVNFCPWCGTAQAHAGAPRPAAAAVPPPVPPPVPPAAAPAAPRPETAAPSASAQPKPAPAPSATAFGRSGKGAEAQASAGQAPPRQEVPRPPLAAHPPQRRPIRLRWWLLALVMLWGVWFVAKPSARKIDGRIDAAIALARECKASDAQAELIALRKSRATPDQLQRLQQALNDEAASCTKRRQRGKAWSEASGAVESALAAASWDKARTRLQAFTRRWGEDEDTRTLKTRIEDLRRDDAARRAHPLAVPPGAIASGSTRPGGAVGSSGGGATGSGGGVDAAQSARNLVESARRDLARGDFGAAADKMTLCLTMVDAGNLDCRALKAQAEQESKLQ